MGRMRCWCVLLAVLALALPGANAKQPQQKMVDNPFLNKAPEPPKYQLPNMDGMQPWNRFEIPQFPNRFAVNFVWRREGQNMPVGGSWIYDYVERKELITYVRDKHWVQGYFFNYQILKERVLSYERGGPSGEFCDMMDLVGGYKRMFSPRSWNRINLDAVETEQSDFYEGDRSDTIIALRGVWNDSSFSVHQYTNGTFRRIAVNNQHWDFFNFRDCTSLDNYDARSNKDLQKLIPPLMQCPYAGRMTPEYAAKLQPRIPFPLVKPKQPEAPDPPLGSKGGKGGKGGGNRGGGRGGRKRGGRRRAMLLEEAETVLDRENEEDTQHVSAHNMQGHVLSESDAGATEGHVPAHMEEFLRQRLGSLLNNIDFEEEE